MLENMWRTFLMILVIESFFSSTVWAFNYKAIESGASYVSVKEYLLARGNNVIELDENRLTTADNLNTLATFVFNGDKLCEVLTNYNKKSFKWIVSFIDLKTRELGSPLRMTPKGENWGDGFTILWQSGQQTLFYDVGRLDLYNGEYAVVKSTEIDGSICGQTVLMR